MTSEERATRANAGNYLSESELVNAIAQEIDDAVAEECVELRERVALLKAMNREGLSAMAEVDDLRVLRDRQEIAIAVLRKERAYRFADWLAKENAAQAEVELLREAGATVMRGFAEGVFVRDVRGDGDSASAIKLLPYLQALAALDRFREEQK